jgi:hypothetical protein
MPGLAGRILRVIADPVAQVELFAIGNLAFLAVDVFVAHSINAFAHPAEWIPMAFSLMAPAMLVVAMAARGGVAPTGGPMQELSRRGQRLSRVLCVLVGGGSILVGVAGLLWHLESQFFQAQTLRSLVYTAPFVAPLSYTGLGLLVLLNRWPPPDRLDWARWVLVLALGGFVGNFILAAADHAQGGLLDWREWIPVVSAAVAVGALVAAVVHFRNRPFLDLCLGLMLAQIVVALTGAVLHIAAIRESAMDSLRDRILYSAPLFAPLLFADLAILAGIALWLLRQSALLEQSNRIRNESLDGTNGEPLGY